jgi:cytochrome c2
MNGLAIGVSLLLLASASAGGAAAADRETDAGRRIAALVCAPCHVVAKDQEFGPMLNEPTPSFEDIANRPGTSAQSLRRFLTEIHWNARDIPLRMPDPMLAEHQKAAVIAYILSLRRAP